MADTPNLSSGRNYPVGHGKPPVETRFKKGQSGNPKGRPKGAKNKPKVSMKMLNDIVMDEAYRDVEIKEQGHVVTIPVAKAVFRSISLKAAKGHVGAQKLFMQIVGTIEEEQKNEKLDTFERASAYKQEKTEEIKILEEQGKPIPKILPHPDDIELDYNTGDVYFHGPISEDDERLWYRLHHQVETLEDEIESILELYDDPESESYRDDLEQELEHNHYILQKTALSAMYRWHLPARDILKKSDFSLRKLLDAHYKAGTVPECPKSFTLLGKSDWEDMHKKYGKGSVSNRK